MGKLDGKVAIVTGASRGIGQHIATRFGAEGAAVAVSARTEVQSDERLPGTIHETVGLVEAAGGTAVAVPADLSKPEDRVRLVEETKEKLGPADILVNNAAGTYFPPAESLPAKRH